MKIRAITFFAKDLSEVEKGEKILLNVKEDIWTKRISFPPTSRDFPLDKLEEIPSSKSLIYSVASLTSDDPRVNGVKDLLSASDNFYANILVRRDQDLDQLSNVILSLEPEQATRLGILFHDWFLVSPYFPISTADVSESSFGLALIYTDEVMQGKVINVFSTADEMGRKLEKQLNIKYLGLDVSLSPWMEKSVGEILEKRSDPLFSISNIWALHRLNQEIAEATLSSKVKPIGFSEVMLPVAEDNVLKRRAEEGRLSLRDLISLTYVCAAGIDMVSIPREKKLLLDLMRTLLSIKHVKMRPIGLRIVPSSGEKVHVKEFGHIPEVKVI